MKPLAMKPLAMRPRIDWTACTGHGLCAEHLPELITLDEWGYPVLEDGPVPRDAVRRARRAAADCPVLALKMHSIPAE